MTEPKIIKIYTEGGYVEIDLAATNEIIASAVPSRPIVDTKKVVNTYLDEEDCLIVVSEE